MIGGGAQAPSFGIFEGEVSEYSFEFVYLYFGILKARFRNIAEICSIFPGLHDRRRRTGRAEPGLESRRAQDHNCQSESLEIKTYEIAVAHLCNYVRNVEADQASARKAGVGFAGFGPERL